MTLQPYQKASNAVQDQAEQPARLLKGAASIGASALGGTAIAARVLPFLNSYIPQNIALKGISKISPALGGFIKSTMDQGHSQSDVMDFIKGKAEESQAPPEEEKKKGNIIEQYSPQLYKSIQQNLAKGMKLKTAVSLAGTQGIYKDVVSKLEKDHKTSLEKIAESIFGQEGTMQNQPNAQAPMPQEQAQPGQGQQALMSILQKIQQSRGA